MWDIDDAIKHFEFLAEEARDNISLEFGDVPCLEAENENWADAADEYDQVVAWLNELKELRRITGVPEK